jgi:hypothetical protein
MPAIKEVGTQLEAVGKDILDLFYKEGSIIAEKLIKVEKSALKAGINSFRTIIKELLKLVTTLLVKIRDLGNAAINILIFIWLYKKISGGHDLILFNTISLVIAVPITVFAKVITEKAFFKLSNLDVTVLGKLLSNDDTVNK